MSEDRRLLDGDRDKLGQYMRELADLMGLRDWTLFLQDDPAPEQYAADIEVRYGRKYANIRFAADWGYQSAESVRTTVVHELLHCHLKPTEWALNNVQMPLGTLVFGVLAGAHQDALEMAVDAIATAWAETLPLPVEADR